MYKADSKIAEEFIDHQEILDTLEYAHNNKSNRALIEQLIDKAAQFKGLSHREAALLLECDQPDLTERIFRLAQEIKHKFYGNRIVMFAPLYLSNYCVNGCVYCPYHLKNKTIARKKLTQEEIRKEVIALQDMGHKRLALEAGEDPLRNPIEYILESIQTIYSIKHKNGAIRRVNVNLAPLSVEDFRRLKERHIGTFQLFQETYHRPTYESVHLAGPKRDLDWRASSFDRAMLAGIDDVGMGLLYGLYDWRYETLALMMHIAHLEERFGVGCHTISVPRIEPAVGSDLASRPPHAVSDEDFLKLVAILRLAVPYTGLIMSTRETAAIRGLTLELGVSQISAGSRTNPGGYKEDSQFEAAQFQLGDHRSLAEVVKDLGDHGFIPSFCTGCYRLGRTGKDFMDLAKPGRIKAKCAPNALSTFEEYLLD